MNLKLCYTCKQRLPESAFAPSVWKRSAGGWCRQCRSSYNKMYYTTNEEKVKARKRIRDRENPPKLSKRRIEQVKWLNEQKSAPCMDCGVSYPPCVMDFDHRDPVQKIRSVSHFIGCATERLEAERAKCDLVCANCHRLRTHGLTG